MTTTMTIEDILKEHDKGVEFVINDGILDAIRYWIFTFGCGQKYGGYYVKIKGTFKSAREEMFKRYGSEWCWQYSEEEWDRIVKNENRHYPLETELEVIE